MLDVTTTTQPTNEISAAMQCNSHCHSHCHTDTVFVQDRSHIQCILQASSFNNCIPVWYWQYSTVCTSDGVQMPVSCFPHDLMWRAHPLVHSGDDSASAKSLERLNTERPRVKRLKSSVLSKGATFDVYLLPPHEKSLNPNGDHRLLCKVRHKKNRA